MWSKQFWSSILRTWRAKTICSTRASARSRVAFLSQNAPRKKHGTPGTPHADWQHILLDTLVNFTKRNQAPNFKDTKAKGAASSAEARNSNLGDQAKDCCKSSVLPFDWNPEALWSLPRFRLVTMILLWNNLTHFWGSWSCVIAWLRSISEPCHWCNRSQVTSSSNRPVLNQATPGCLSSNAWNISTALVTCKKAPPGAIRWLSCPTHQHQRAGQTLWWMICSKTSSKHTEDV